MKTASAPVLAATPSNSGSGTGGVIELVWPAEDGIEQDPMTRRGILLCREGQIVARPALADADSPRDPASSTLRLGPGVAWDAARGAYVACRNGHVRFVQDKLDVSETLDWSKDLDAAPGPFAFDGDVIIRHGVLDLVVLKSSRDVVVHDCVEAADIQAARDVTVHHGICGKEKGLVRAGGCVSARFLSNARIIAGGDVVVENEIDNSRIQCGGELRVEQGTIMAGYALATAGIVCHTAGSKSGVRTILELGISPEQQKELQRLTDATAARQQKAKEIRTAVQPLLATQRSLTPAQKEKATELLFLADQLEGESLEMEKQTEALRRPLEQATGGVIRIASMLFPGVIVRFPGIQGCVAEPMRGSRTVKLVSSGTQRRIVAVDESRGTEFTLPPVDARGSFTPTESK